VRYGIMTPYTSFLVDEGQEILTDAGRRQLAATSELSAPSNMPVTGAKAVADSQASSTLVESERGGGMEAPEIKVLANKAFVLRQGVWTDTSLDPERMQVNRVQFGSAAYFDLFAEHPEWGKYFALGEEVIVVTGDVAYQIVLEEVEHADRGTLDGQAALQRLLEWLRSIGR
jgi:hypothetical protein